jgi:NitT/TauT family transport system permease protein
MAQVFRVPFHKKVFYLYRPALSPYLISACKSALGMAFKSGIAAEVIGVPDFSIGANLYEAKIYLDTASLFAWTLAIILIASCFEKILLRLMTAAGGKGNTVHEKQ